MKKYDFDVYTTMIHAEGLPGYVAGEAVQVVTDASRKNLMIHDKKRQRMIVLPYVQLVSVSYGTIPSANGAGRVAVGMLVGGIAGAMIGAASADPKQNSVIIQYRSSAGDVRQMVLNVHPSFPKDGADVAGILNANIQTQLSGPMYL